MPETNDALGTEELEVDLEEEVELTPEKEEEEEEEEEVVKDKEGKEGEKEEEEEEESSTKLESPTFKEVNTKYPKLFKDFPGLRKAFFGEQEYRKLFPSVEEAKEASETIESYNDLQSSISSGKMEDLVNVLKSFDDLGDDVVSNVAANFLPALKKINQDAYYDAMQPELQNLCRSLYDQGVRNENDNLKNAGLLLAQHIFGDMKVASGEKQIPTKQPAKRDEELEKERAKFRSERYSVLYNDVVSESNSKLKSIIKDGLDPRGVMTDAMKEILIEKVMKEINNTLVSDTSHTSQMNSLWRKAKNDGFSSSNKSKIIAAYLERAKELVPSIRSKVRSAALGTKTQKAERDSEDTSDSRKEPRSNTGGGDQSNKGKGNGKQVDWSKTSDLDYIRGKIVYKS